MEKLGNKPCEYEGHVCLNAKITSLIPVQFSNEKIYLERKKYFEAEDNLFSKICYEQ